MNSPSNHDKIEKDIVAEKNIILKHKERQTAILSQIETFKKTMKTQIVKLQEQIEVIKVQINDSTTDMTTKTTTHNEEKENLESEIKNLVQQHEKNLIEKNETISKNTNDLTTLTESINDKKTEILKLNNINLSKISSLSQTKINFKQHEDELASLNVKIVEIKAAIATQEETNNKLTIQEKEHNTQIMTDIKSLTEITNEMKIEFETSQQLTSVLNEN